MSDIKANLYKCFYSLDANFFADFVSNINKRIVFQKYGLIFATIFGLELGSYSLYLHGPYNSSLADVGYEFANDFKQEKQYENFIIPNIAFSDSAVEIISYLKTNLSLNDTNFLEVFSTYFYLKNYKKYENNVALEKVQKIKNDIIIKRQINLDEMQNVYINLKEYINNIAGSKVLA